MKQVAETVIRRRATGHPEKGRIVIFAGPFTYFSTTPRRAQGFELVPNVLSRPKVDGMAHGTPENIPAKRLPKLTYMDALRMLQSNGCRGILALPGNKIPTAYLTSTRRAICANSSLKEKTGSVGQSGMDIF